MMYKFTIPEKIKVGFQKRKDTYTGSLAYVVYTDTKGVLRKKRSWEGWRDTSISPKEFENVPTEGFVLNKKVGETRWGWNPRKAWVRVYDPRDFEFEISVANLLLILEECSSIKGKGLEGEFVYAWDRAELILLPVTSQEYQESLALKKASQKKVTKKDMKEGLCYLNKEGEEVMYLGRHPFWRWYDEEDGFVFKSEKKHIFAYITKNDDTWYVQKGFTNLVSKLSDEPSPLFAERFEEFKNSKYGSAPVKLIRSQEGHASFIEEGGKYYQVNVAHHGIFGSRELKRRISHNSIEMSSGNFVKYPCGPWSNRRIDIKPDSVFNLKIVNEAGAEIEVMEFYHG